MWNQVRRATRRGLDSGALWSIPTTAEVIEDGGVAFGVRLVDNLRRKGRARWNAATEAGGRPGNPFLPYDEELYVAHVGDTHVCLLNKFNVLDHHLLIVTAGFEDQRTLLTEADLHALWSCMAEVDGLGFYNGGAEAGASQPHKHLQLAPFPLVPGGGAGTPVDGILEGACTTGGIHRSEALPFVHAAVRLDDLSADADAAAPALRERYLDLLDHVGRAPDRSAPLPHQTGPYNLLLTRRWMLAVARAEEFFETLSLNALAFAGGLLVKDDIELARVREVGPMALLRHCGVP
ncbi:MAG: DUF4922 domain-containing protein [Myxococcota bacterium]|nr:DUF4922 domain-containing protein [Myxococcota bacterium]